jgi:hypothetical protein
VKEDLTIVAGGSGKRAQHKKSAWISSNFLHLHLCFMILYFSFFLLLIYCIIRVT